MSDEREKFEAWAWATEQGYNMSRDGPTGAYSDYATESAWFAWQARAAETKSQWVCPFCEKDKGCSSELKRHIRKHLAAKIRDTYEETETKSPCWISVSDELPPLGEWDWDSVAPDEGAQQSKPMPLLLEDGMMTWGIYWQATDDHGVTASDCGWTSQDGMHEYQREIKPTHWMKL